MAKKAVKPLISTENLPQDLRKEAQRLLHLKGDEHPRVKHFLSTGCDLLDLNIHTGTKNERGLPSGRVIEVFGLESVAKTGMALEFVEEAQKLNGIGVWFDLEGNLSEELCTNIVGVSLDENAFIYIDNCNITEKIFETLELFIKRASQSVFPTVIVLDSIAALVPEDLSESKMSFDSPWRNGLQPQLLYHFFQRGTIQRYMKSSNVYLIVNNQLRTNFNFNPHGPSSTKRTSTGGLSVPYYATVRINLTRVKRVFDEESPDRDPIYDVIQADVYKNKVGQACRIAEFPFWTRPNGAVTGIDNVWANMEYLITHGVMKQSGAWYTLGDDKLYKKDWWQKAHQDLGVATQMEELVTQHYLSRYGISADTFLL